MKSNVHGMRFLSILVDQQNGPLISDRVESS
jgi:hypothetical protein